MTSGDGLFSMYELSVSLRSPLSIHRGCTGLKWTYENGNNCLRISNGSSVLPISARTSTGSCAISDYLIASRPRRADRDKGMNEPRLNADVLPTISGKPDSSSDGA
jgi:hypothetical protein